MAELKLVQEDTPVQEVILRRSKAPSLEDRISELEDAVEEMQETVEAIRESQEELEGLAMKSLGISDEIVSAIKEHTGELRRRWVSKEKREDTVLNNVVLRFLQEMVRVTRLMKFGKDAKFRIMKRRK